MSDRIVICVGTKKGLFVAESSKNRRKFELRGPFGPGVAVYSAMIDTRSKAPRIFASSCNAFFGMKVLCSTDVGKNSRKRNRRRCFRLTTDEPLPISGPSSPGTTKRNFGAVSSQQPCSTVTIPETRGRWLAGSAITITPENGILVTAACVCTRSSATGTGCTWESQPAATI